MIKAAILAGVILSGALISAGQTTREPCIFFREQMELSDDQIARIARGRAVTKVLPSKTPSEILVFGAVFVNAMSEEYVKLAFDMDRLRHSARSGDDSTYAKDNFAFERTLRYR